MAEPTGKDMPETDPKSATAPSAAKTGPVKPPVLEGTARPAAGSGPSTSAGPTAGKPAAASTTDKPGTRPTDKPAERTGATTDAASRPAPPTRTDADKETGGAGSAWLAGIVGGALGLGAAYGLAWFGLWPAPAQAPADPRLAQFATAIPELETVTGTVQDELSTLSSRVGALETSQAEAPASASADPGLAEDVAGLASRLDALAATAGQGTDSEALATLRADIDTLRSDLASARTQLAESQQQLSALSQSADAAASAEAATLRLPLILSGLEAAFDSGRAYEAELTALRQALPEAAVPEALAARAADGLPRPDQVSRDLSARLPDMLAGRPAPADADWQTTTADWFRGLIAMRPTGAVDGDAPDAIIARLEAAVERRDFIAAKAELDALPPPMHEAAGAVAQDIESLAAAQAFLADMREQALTMESGA